MEQIERIRNKVAWLRSFKAGDVKTAQFASPKECQSFSVQISRWNVEEGFEKGIKLSAMYNRPLSMVTVTATHIGNQTIAMRDVTTI